MPWLFDLCLYRGVLWARQFRPWSIGCHLLPGLGQSRGVLRDRWYDFWFSFYFVAYIAKTTRALDAAEGRNWHLSERLVPVAPERERFTNESSILAAAGISTQFATGIDGEFEPHSIVRSVEASQCHPPPLAERPFKGNGVSSDGQYSRGVPPRSSDQQDRCPGMGLLADNE